MRQYQVDMLKFCSITVRESLDSFCKKINQSNADVFLIMAHKAVQLFFILLEQGYINDEIFKKIVITNQALDFNCDYLFGKKITIIDDIVISGTSIASTINKLLEMGIHQGDIEVIAVAKDSDYFKMRFENISGDSVLHCDTVLKDAECIELSVTISKIFSHYGVPYDVDFPTYESTLIEPKKLKLFHDNIFWDICDVTNGNQQAGQVSSYTLYPTQCVRKKLWDLIGIELEECVHLKVRTYIKKYRNGTLGLSVVPMCLFNEISESKLTELYVFLKPENTDITLNKNNLFIAQMRYLQFYVAHQLYVIFSEIMALGQGESPHKDMLLQLFGLVDGETIYNAICVPHQRKTDLSIPKIYVREPDNAALLKEYNESSIGQRSLKNLQYIGQSDEFEQMCWLNQTLFDPFLWWYDTKEIEVRKELRDSAPHYIHDRERINKLLYRLNSGFSLATLRGMLRLSIDKLPADKADRVISSLLDRAIDDGIIVPTIYYRSVQSEKSYLCRAYRHGEDLPFGLADECRLLRFIQGIGEKIPSVKTDEQHLTADGIAKVSLEKMIVLFYQMGLRQGGIFNHFLGFNNLKILHSFLSVHGTVQAFTKEGETEEIHMYSERNSRGEEYITWLTSWLKDRGFIAAVDESDHSINQKQIINMSLVNHYLDKETRSSICKSVGGSIDDISDIISEWYNKASEGVMKYTFKDAATALTSCANGYVYASAIGTEIHYFSKFWANQAKSAFAHADNSHLLISALTKIPKNREYFNTITQGLNSGRDKVLWFEDQAALEILENVEMTLSSKESRKWSNIWGDNRPKFDTNPELEDLTNEAVSFLYFFSICFDCLRSKEFWDNGEMPEQYDKYKKRFLDSGKLTNKIQAYWLDDLKEIADMSGKDVSQKAEKFDEFVKDLISLSESCVSNIENNIKQYAPNYTIKYTSSLIVDIHAFQAFDKKKIDTIFTDFWMKLPEDEDKTELIIVRFPEQSCTAPLVRYGIFYGSTAQTQSTDVQQNPIASCEDILFSIFEKLCELFNGKVYEMRGIMLPHITPAYMFMHNLQKNIEEYAEKFYKEVVRPIESCYAKNTKLQLILGLDRNVSQNFVHRFDAWKKGAEIQKIADARWLSNCIVFYHDHIKPIVAETTDRISYSLVRIECGKNHGFGFLLRLPDKVVCVSCNHLILPHKEESMPITATSVYDPHVDFQLENIKAINSYVSKVEVLPVMEEIAILVPCWNRRIPLDFSMLLEKSDLDMNTKAYINKGCRCYGSPVGRPLKWETGMILHENIEENYYQISGDITSIKSGFSGCIYKSEDASHSIIGMHEGRYISSHISKDEKPIARMIPCSAIIQAIHEEEQKWKQEKL